MVKNLSTVERSTKIRFGKNCTDEQGENTIVFNASNEQIDSSKDGALYMTPIRFENTGEEYLLTYDFNTKEIVNSGIKTAETSFARPDLEEVTAIGNTTTRSIGIANTNPQHLLSVSNIMFVSNVGEYHLRVSGNVYADSLRIGSSILMNSSEATNQVQVSGQIKSDSVLIDSRLAIANTSPTKDFSVGNLLFIDRGNSNIIQTSGNIEARTFFGSGSYLTGLSLDDIANRNSTTSASLNLTNDGTALTTTGNVVVGNTLSSNNIEVKNLSVGFIPIVTDNNVLVDSKILSPSEGTIQINANLITQNVITSLTTESNLIADNVVSSHIFGPIEGANSVTASIVYTDNVTANNITANIFFGDGGLLSNIATTLQAVTDNGNVTDQVVQFTNPTTAFTTDLVSNVLVNIGQLNDVTLSTPSADQVLMHDGARWVNEYPNHNFVRVKNISTTAILNKGTVVYVAGPHNQNILDVAPADASDPNKMPAIGVIYADIAPEGEGLVVAYGRAQGINVNGFLEGEVIFVSNTLPGRVSNVKPLGPTDGIQNIGICTKTGTDGTIFVTGVGRTNDIPNAPVVTAQPDYVYVNTVGNELKKIAPSNLLTKYQTLEQVVNTGNTVANTIQVTGLSTTDNIYVTQLTDQYNKYLTMVDIDGELIRSPVYVDDSGRYVITASEAEFLGNLTLGGNTTILSSSSLVVEDRIIGIGANNYASGLDMGIIMEHQDAPGDYSNLAIIYHTDEHVLRLGYTKNTWTDNHVTSYFNPAHPMRVAIEGNVTVQNSMTIVHGSYFGDGTTLTGVAQILDPTFTNNVTVSNTLETSNLIVKNVANVQGDITANYFIGDGSQLTGIASNLQQITDNGNVTSNTIQFTNPTTGIVATGNIYANTFIGDGSQLTGIASNLQQITDNGNVTSNTIQFTNPTTGIVATGNIYANTFIGDGSLLTGIASNLQQITDTGNVTSNTIQFTNPTTGIVATGNIYANTFIGDGSQLTGIQTGASNLQSVSDTGNVTSNTIQFTNPTTGIVTTSNIELSGVTLNRVGGDNILGQLGTSLTYQTSNRLYGYSVDLSSDGSRMVVGVYADEGEVRVYEYNQQQQSWMQFGSTITGNGLFGYSVAMSSDGTKIIVGVLDDGVYLYEYDFDVEEWNEIHSFSGFSTGDKFGTSVAMNSDGTKIVIGAPEFGEDDRGAVYAYELRYGTDWFQYGPTLSGVYEGENFGNSVAMSSDGLKIVVGVPGYDSTPLIDRGAVYTYTFFNSFSQWIRDGTLYGSSAYDNFGTYVDMSSDGTKIIVGAPNVYTNIGGTSYQTGSVYAYEYSASAWNQYGTVLYGSVGGDKFGTSVSIETDVIAVSSATKYSVYKLESSAWSLFDDVSTGLSTNTTIERLPVSLSSDGLRVAFGNPYSTPNVVSVYDFNGISPNILNVSESVIVNGNIQANYFIGDGSQLTGIASNLQQITDNGNVTSNTIQFTNPTTGIVTTSNIELSGVTLNRTGGEYVMGQLGTSLTYQTSNRLYGYSVDLSSDGSRMVVGARGSNYSYGAEVRVYEYNQQQQSWVQFGSTINGNGLFGYSVAMRSDGNRIVVGAPGDGPLSGSVRVYIYDDEVEDWSEIHSFPSPESDDKFGTSVAMSSNGRQIVIGAPYSGTDDKGAVYAYEYDLENGVWNQYGTVLYGSNADDNFGTSVAMSSDGSKILVGAPGYDSIDIEFDNNGAVYAYEYGVSQWNQYGTVLYGSTYGANFGTSVAMSSDGTKILVGAPGYYAIDLELDDNGAVYAYEYSASAWNQYGTVLYGSTYGEKFGTSVSIETDIIAVSSATKYSVYKLESSAWSLLDDVITGLSTAGTYERLPVSLSSDGLRVAFGNPYSTPNVVNVYDFSSITPQVLNVSETVVVNGNVQADYFVGSGTELTGLTLQSISDKGNVTSNTIQFTNPTTGLVTTSNIELSGVTLNRTGGYNILRQLGQDLNPFENFSEFGYSVALSSNGNRGVVGLPDIDDVNGSGSVFIGEYDGTSWNLIGNPISSSHTFGSSVAISSDGTKIVVGAPNAYTDIGGTVYPTGAVYAYEFDGNQWNQYGTIRYGSAGGDKFGTSVAMSSDGTKILVGAPGYDSTPLIDRGAVYAYEYSVSAWNQYGTVLYGSAGGDEFGTSVAMSSDGTKILVGAPGYDSIDIEFDNNGAVYAYEYGLSRWNQYGTVLYGSTYGANFGTSVAMSSDGTKILVGAPGYYAIDLELNDNGSVYAYEYSASAWNQYGTVLYGSTYGEKFGTSVSIETDVIAVSSATKYSVYKLESSAWSLFDDVSTGLSTNTTIERLPVSLSSDGLRVAFCNPYSTTKVVRIYDFIRAPVSLNVSDSVIVNGNVEADYLVLNSNIQMKETTLYATPTTSIFSNIDVSYTPSSVYNKHQKFGNSVSLSSDGSTLVVGISGLWDIGAGDVKGGWAVFRRTGNSWNLSPNYVFMSPYAPQNTPLGGSVAITPDGSRVVISAPDEDPSTNQGYFGTSYVQVLGWNGSYWQTIGFDIYNPELTWKKQRFGASVDISSNGNRIVVGGPSWDSTIEGKVYVYNYAGGSWNSGGAKVGQVGEFFGTSVAISSDGTKIVVGAPSYGVTPNLNTGAVYVYEYNNGTFNQYGTVLYGSGSNNFFGTSVAINSDGTKIVVGAPGNGSTNGSVYAYEYISSTWIQYGSTMNGTLAGGLFGTSVAMNSDGDKIVAAGGIQSSGTSAVYNYTTDWDLVRLKTSSTSNYGASAAISDDGKVYTIGATQISDPVPTFGLVEINYEDVIPALFNISTDVYTDGNVQANYFLGDGLSLDNVITYTSNTVIQEVSRNVYDVISYGSTSGVRFLYSFQTTITPKSSDCKILIEFTINYEANENVGFLIYRDGIAVGYNSSYASSSSIWNTVTTSQYDGNTDSTPGNVVVKWEDTSTLTKGTSYTYQLVTRSTDTGSYPFYLNRTAGGPATNQYEVMVSHVSIKEIKK